MKAPLSRTHAIGRERSQVMIAARVLQLFRRMPMLLGFSIRDDLSIAEVEVLDWPGCAWGKDFHDELHDQISAAVVQLINEREDAAELLRGRTFARALQ